MDKKPKDENHLKSSIVDWNYRRPLDRWWREKYKIPFNSPAHREVSYIDISLEYQETIWVDEYRNSIIQREEDKKDFENTGRVFKTTTNNVIDSQKEATLFDKIKF